MPQPEAKSLRQRTFSSSIWPKNLSRGTPLMERPGSYLLVGLVRIGRSVRRQAVRGSAIYLVLPPNRPNRSWLYKEFRLFVSHVLTPFTVWSDFS